MNDHFRFDHGPTDSPEYYERDETPEENAERELRDRKLMADIWRDIDAEFARRGEKLLIQKIAES